MVHGLWDGKRVHLAGAIEAALDCLLQIMASDLHCQRIADRVSGALFELDPRRMRQRDPYRPPTHQKLDIYGVSVARRNGNDHSLELDMNFLPSPAVADSKIVVHGSNEY